MLTAKCSTSYARNRVEEETISTKEDIISHRLLLTDEMRLICMFEDSFPSGGFVDAKGFLITLRSDYSYIDLPSLGLLRTMLGTLKRVTAFFNGSKDGLYPNLKKMSEPVSFYPEIARRIDLILDKAGDVRDNASENLALIRRSLKDKESSIMRRIGAILRQAQVDGIADEDAAVSVRDGKTLIPISAANKKKIAGIVYDESSSGKTAFIEPLEVVELNNQVRALRFEEQREIMRILAEFTDFLRPYLDDLVSSAEYLGEIDFIRAKALVAMDMIAGMPIISKNGELSLRKARHPLLETALRKERKEIVPLNLFLNKEKHILLISGPNAGGKSVCLKTVGLLQYMFQWGMLIPTSEVSEMTIFNNIFIDIGDDQSIENDLSTYSSHLTNMKNIVIRADARSLVLIDEFGGGTEPAAGGAIAEAVLAELDKAGAYGVITTHYTNLKLYADSSRGVVNGAMLFDTAAIAPLFKLEQGLPGNSFAFELARKIGLPEAIIKSAEERAGNDFVDMERQLRKIARNRRALDEKLTRIKATDKTLEGLTDKYQKELSEIKALKKSII
ncbi:MAG: endonuclease MutS2, partial [Bacteroidales bacterium]|nr:endonuclease MutS2 [Bacteroidales bacterium]